MKFIDDSIQMDDKCVFSHRVFNLITLLSAIGAGVMELLCFILYFTVPDIGLYVYSLVFYPICICLVLVFFFSIPELLRNIYMTSLISVIAGGILTAVLIVSILLQVFMLGTVYIVPFIYL